MRRESLEPQLDRILGTRLTDPLLLQDLVREYEVRMVDPISIAARARLETEASSLTKKRERVLSAYFDGVIDSSERDTQLGSIRAELKLNEALIAQHTPTEYTSMDVLESICSTFHDWEFLNVSDKRRILASTGAQISVSNNSVQGLYVNLPESRHDEMNRTDRDS